MNNPVLIDEDNGSTSVFLDPRGDDHIVVRMIVDARGFERDITQPCASPEWDKAVERAWRARAFLEGCPIEGGQMPLSKHIQDKLLAELQSGTMTSGAVSISVGPLPAGYVRFDSWPTAPAPVHGMLTDPATGQSWRIRLNQDTKQWEIVDERNF